MRDVASNTDFHTMKPLSSIVMSAAVLMLSGCGTTPDAVFTEPRSSSDSDWYVRKTIWFAQLPKEQVRQRSFLHAVVTSAGVPPFTTKPRIVSRNSDQVIVRVTGSRGTVDLQYNARTGDLVGGHQQRTIRSDSTGSHVENSSSYVSPDGRSVSFFEGSVTTIRE